MKKICVLQLIALGLYAADKPVEPPKIDPTHLADFYRVNSIILQLQATMRDAQNSLKDAQVEMKSAIDAIQKDCGDKFVPYQDPTSKLSCMVKPEEKK